jgi:tRNA pseudouridine38-40 synthase
MSRKRCICEYDGSAYSGWQCQDGVPSVQEEIEKALLKLFGEEIRINSSGRTDAGVHALGQVFHFDSTVYRSPETVTRAVNSMIPRDIVILDTLDVPDSFDARKSAKNKTYLYRIINRPVRASLENGRAWYRRSYLDEKKLAELLVPLIGKHDFASFCVKKSLKENTVRTVNSITCNRIGDIIELHYNGNGFLHNMVRIITGTAVELCFTGGTAADMERIIAMKDREAAFMTAPACGLYLEKVNY